MTESGTHGAAATRPPTSGRWRRPPKSRTYLGEGFEYGYTVPRAVLCVVGILGLAAVLAGETWAIVAGGVCVVVAIAGLTSIALRHRQIRARAAEQQGNPAQETSAAPAPGNEATGSPQSPPRGRT